MFYCDAGRPASMKQCETSCAGRPGGIQLHSYISRGSQKNCGEPGLPRRRCPFPQCRGGCGWMGSRRGPRPAVEALLNRASEFAEAVYAESWAALGPQQRAILWALAIAAAATSAAEIAERIALPPRRSARSSPGCLPTVSCGTPRCGANSRWRRSWRVGLLDAPSRLRPRCHAAPTRRGTSWSFPV